MAVNIDNYEQYAIDLWEGKLPDNLKHDMEHFLKRHPELANELSEASTIRLQPQVVTYPFKDRLKTIADSKTTSLPIYVILGAAATVAILLGANFFIKNGGSSTGNSNNTAVIDTVENDNSETKPIDFLEETKTVFVEREKEKPVKRNEKKNTTDVQKPAEILNKRVEDSFVPPVTIPEVLVDDDMTLAHNNEQNIIEESTIPENVQNTKNIKDSAVIAEPMEAPKKKKVKGDDGFIIESFPIDDVMSKDKKKTAGDNEKDDDMMSTINEDEELKKKGFWKKIFNGNDEKEKDLPRDLPETPLPDNQPDDGNVQTPNEDPEVLRAPRPVEQPKF